MKTFKKLIATACFVALTVNSNAQWTSVTNGVKLTTPTNNVGIGNDHKSNAKLRLYNSMSSSDTIFGLHTTMENTSTSGYGPTYRPPLYGIHSTNASSSYGPLYGAYFKNTLSYPSSGPAIPLYGIYLDNSNSAYSGTNYGVYTKNTSDSYTGTIYGFYADNSISSYSGSAYGIYAKNTGGGSNGGTSYGAYLSNDRPGGGIPGSISTVYGLYSTNTNSANGPVYGAHLSATSLTSSSAVYGLYSTVSGGAANQCYAGYFTGGNVAVMDGNVGIGTNTPNAKLDVIGNAKVNELETSKINAFPNETFIYDGKSLGHYSVGWYWDSWNTGSPTSWYSAHGGIKFFAGSTARMVIKANGNVGIGKDPHDNYKLDVDGIIRAREVIVNTNAGADFVFDESYSLRPLDEVHHFIRANKHLPEIPSAANMIENGIDMGEFQIKLLQKMEELTLYIIAQDKRIEELERNAK